MVKDRPRPKEPEIRIYGIPNDISATKIIDKFKENFHKKSREVILVPCILEEEQRKDGCPKTFDQSAPRS